MVINQGRIDRRGFVGRTAAALGTLGAIRPSPSVSAPIIGAGSGVDSRRIDYWVNRVMTAWRVPGAVATVVKGDRIAHLGTYGVRKVGEPTAVGPDTSFHIASLSKSFCATIAAMLVEDSMMAWEDPATSRLPSLVFSDPWVSKHATVRDLFAMRTGISSDTAFEGTPGNRQFTLPAIVDAVKTFPFEAPFRSRFLYVNVNYIVGSQLCQHVAGLPFPALEHDRIFAALGMNHTAADNATALSLAGEDRAWAHGLGGNAVRVREDWAGAPWSYDTAMGGGNVHSTARDMAQWLRLHLNRGMVDGVRLLPESSFDELHRAQSILPREAEPSWGRDVDRYNTTHYGLGWNVKDYRRRRLLSHEGTSVGHRAWMAVVPEESLGLFVAMNINPGTRGIHALGLSILDHLLGQDGVRDWVAFFQGR